VGLHLLQSLDLVDTPRPSTVAELDPSGALIRLEHFATDAEIVVALGDSPVLVVADCPLAVPNDAGQRDVERLLAWCDIPVFPVSRRRLQQVFGGLRGVRIAESLVGTVELVETSPDLVLRQLAWEERHPGAPLDLADYRERWIALRPPAYRPKGPGRAKPAGIIAAHALLARHVDLQGWLPSGAGDDWNPIRDAAALDAIACAYVTWRATVEPGRVLRIGRPDRGEMLLPVDANLAARIAINLDRLRAEGSVGI
jgi:hypothetical protein